MQRVEREGGVAEPAVAVVPVADAADALRAARSSAAATMPPVGAIGQRLERDRASARTASRQAPWYVQRRAPVAPPLRSVSSQRASTSSGLRRRLVRGMPGRGRTAHVSPADTVELGQRREVPRHGSRSAIRATGGPARRSRRRRRRACGCTHGTTRAVVEADDRAPCASGPAADALDDPARRSRRSRRGGMQSTTRDGAGGRLELGLEDQRVVAIPAPDVADAVPRREQPPCRAPASPSSAAKQAGESNRGRQSQSIEPLRPTSAAVSHVADQRVVLDSHGATSRGAAAMPRCPSLLRHGSTRNGRSQSAELRAARRPARERSARSTDPLGGPP